MAFGQFFLLPIIGASLFGALTYALKTIHNFVGPLFVVTLVLMFITFVRDNLPRMVDFKWLAKFGGLFGGKEVPSHRFNAGEKLVFWGGVLVLGTIVAGSGLFLDKLLPGFVYTRGEMQVAHMIHGVATMLMMAMILGHIYIGTLGMTAPTLPCVTATWTRRGRASTTSTGTTTLPPARYRHSAAPSLPPPCP